MNFLSVPYAIFLFSVLIIYWIVRKEWERLLLLLIASLVFYASWQVQYLPLLGIMTVLNFNWGRQLSAPADWRVEDWQFAQQDWNRKRIRLLTGAIAINVFLLFSFKYIPFSLEILSQLFRQPALQTAADWWSDRVAAPWGLSFFCFECIAYLVDVYRGAPAAQQWLPFFSYKLFFPKILSGPITSFHTFMSQFKQQKPPTPDQVVEGLWLITCGAIKKGLIADNLAVWFINPCFSNLQRMGSSDLWLAILAYGIQLYLDFSGYVDIVRGSALLLGFTLPENFNFPYFTTSIAEFWRRWHITLGDWLRNYLYFPLGGSRHGLLRTCMNLFLVMLIGGIWHGAAWGFIVWGILHGLGLIIHRLTDGLCKRVSWLADSWKNPLGIVVAWMLTQGMVFFAWIFFRLPNLQDSGWVVRHLWGQPSDAQFMQKIYLDTLGLDPYQFAVLLGAIVLIMGFLYLIQRGLKLSLNWYLKIFLVPVSLYAVWMLSPDSSPPYIYFDF